MINDTFKKKPFPILGLKHIGQKQVASDKKIEKQYPLTTHNIQLLERLL